jgi:hypothetical protein
MKQRIAIAMCLLAGLGVVSASAQDHAARATVPFGFYAGDAWVPAGTYVITSDSKNPEVIAIRNLQTGRTVMSLGGRDEPQAGSNKLVFDEYGNQYFLHEILCSSRGMNVQFQRSKKEKLAAEQEASDAPPSTIYLALR